MFRIFIKNCRLIAIAADYCHKSLFYTFTSISAVTCCRWGEQFVIFRCQVSLWCCVLKIGCCFSCSIHKVVSERSRETWYIVMELLHANYLVLAHELFCMFCKVIFRWRLELRRHIALKFEALWHCTGVNRQLQMMWQLHLLLPHHPQVLSKFLYISGPAQPLESHRFSGEKTRLQTWHLRSSGPTSALIFSGNARPMSPVYSIYSTNRPQATCDRWPVRCLGSCSCVGADEFATSSKRVENRTFLKMFKTLLFCSVTAMIFCSTRNSEPKTTCPRWRDGSCDMLQRGSATWARSLNHVENNA